MTAERTLTDDELLRLVVAGDEAAFTALYRQQQGGIYRFALRMCGSPAIAEDVTQEVFMILMKEARRYDRARGSLSTYLFGIARNQVLRRLGRESSYVPIQDDWEEESTAAPEQLVADSDPLAELARNELIESVRQAVLALPAHYREVVVLCDLHEMGYAEAAIVLGCAIGTVRSRLHRARALLVKKLRACAGSEPASSQATSVRCLR
jgi:RNA polymerase sigma-70 factor (ECF subfamily)